MQHRVPVQENKVGIEVAEEMPSLKREFIGDTHRVLEHTQNHTLGNQQQKGQICSWVGKEVTESWPRAEHVALFRLRPLPHKQLHKAAMFVAPPW